MSTDAWLAPDTCGVKLTEFEALSQIIDEAAGTLDELSSLLSLMLAKAGVSTAPAQDIGRIAQWARDHAPDLKRRSQLAHDINKQKYYVFACRADGLYLLLPDRFQDQVAAFDAGRAANLIRTAADGEAKALDALWRLGGMPTTNPCFAKTLLRALGASGVTEIPIKLAELLRTEIDHYSDQLDNRAAETRNVFTILKQALALCTDPASSAYLGPTFLSVLAEEGRQHFPPRAILPNGFAGYQGLSAILGADGSCEFSATFMRTVGQDMVRFDQETALQLSSYGKQLPELSGKLGLGNALDPATINVTATQEPDPVGRGDFLVSLFDAAASSKPAAQTLLLGPLPSSGMTLYYLLHDRRALWGLSDKGASLGRALMVAGSGPGSESEQLFRQTIRTLAPDIIRRIKWISRDGKNGGLFMSESDKESLDQLSGLRVPLGHLLAAHFKEAASEFSTDGEGSISDIPSQAEMLAMIADISQDGDAFASLTQLQLRQVRSALDSYFASGRRSFGGVQKELEVLGRILAMRQETMLARGEAADQHNKQVHDLVSKMADYLPKPNITGPLRSIIDEIESYSISELKGLITQRFLDGSEKLNTAEARELEKKLIEMRVEQIALISALAHNHPRLAELKGESFAENGVFTSPQTWTAEQRQDFEAWIRSRQYDIFDATNNIKNIIENIDQDAVSKFLLMKGRTR